MARIRKRKRPLVEKRREQLAHAEGTLKAVGGSDIDKWNHVVADQVMKSHWMKNTDPATQQKQLHATLGALIGIAPKDEIEGMLAAQMIACHNAATQAEVETWLTAPTKDALAFEAASRRNVEDCCTRPQNGCCARSRNGRAGRVRLAWRPCDPTYERLLSTLCCPSRSARYGRRTPGNRP